MVPILGLTSLVLLFLTQTRVDFGARLVPLLFGHGAHCSVQRPRVNSELWAAWSFDAQMQSAFRYYSQFGARDRGQGIRF